jgi:osmoprotectant transport system ATP-binding protein
LRTAAAPGIAVAMAPPALSFDRVSLARNGQAVLADVSLAVPAGALVALVGPSGAGKTTLLRCINRMLVPDGGRICHNGVDVTAGDALQLRRSIGYAVQGGGLFPHWTVADNIAAVPWLLGWKPAARATRVAELLALVDLPAGLASRFPGQLSGGQASRVGLARALAAKPGLLLLDEPFGALDPDTRAELGARLAALHRAQGLTTIIVTHDLADALLNADMIVVLGGGRLLAAGAPADVAANPHPDVQALLAPALDQARRLAGLAAR